MICGRLVQIVADRAGTTAWSTAGEGVECTRAAMNAEVSVDRDGRVQVRFDTDIGGPLAFMGRITAVNKGTLTADVEAGDQTPGLRGPMIIRLDNRRQVSSIAMEGTAGRRDTFRLRWQRR